MNERIKELARQSQMVFWPTDPEVVELSKDIDIEKFAELIIQECADLNFRELGLSGSISFDIGRMIKQHFGVEE